MTRALVELAATLDSLGVEWLVVGSVASSAFGSPRYTNDVDLEIWVSPVQIEGLEGLSPDRWIADPLEIRNSLSDLRDFASFQLIHNQSNLKFVCFPKKGGAFEVECLTLSVAIEMEGRAIRFAFPEHVIIQKLRWFELGNRASERQWKDITGIYRVTPKLNRDFLQRWAKVFQVEGLEGEAAQSIPSDLETT